MKTLDEYILESGGFFGNTKTSKTDLVMDWIKTYMPKIMKNHNFMKVNDYSGVISISNNNAYNVYNIGDKDSPPLDGIPPVKFIIKNIREDLRILSYNCDIKKFDFPLNIYDFINIEINKCDNISKSEFSKILKMINDAKSIKKVQLNINENIKELIDGKELKSLKRNFENLVFYPECFDKIEFNQNIKIDNILFRKTLKDQNKIPKIITLPIYDKIYFPHVYEYNDIIEMLSDYTPNPNMKNIYKHVNIWNGNITIEERKHILNILSGKE